MARPVAPRFPWDDLERLVAARMGPRWHGGTDDGRANGWTDVDLGAVFGMSRVALQAVRARRTVSIDQADRLAVAAGFHPAEVWPYWYEVVGAWDDECEERREAERVRRRERVGNRRAAA